MKTDDLFFWREMPVGRRKGFFQATSLGALLLFFLVWLFLYMATGEAMRRSQSLRETYAKVSSLAQEASSLETREAALAKLAPMAAAQQISREMGLEKRISSVRPAQIGGSQEGVQMYFEGLNLPELTNLLTNLRNRGGLKFVSVSISHRLDAPDLADLQLVMVR